MKIRIPVMVQDPTITARKGMEFSENIELEDEFFLDGPISRSVAVLDFNPQSGELDKGATFVAPEPDRVIGGYAVEPDLEDAQFIQVSVFGTIMKTIALFQRNDILGRPITWGFGSPQILVIPNAGEWANAFYERASRSLQFFGFDHDGVRVRTALSRDIVAHEVGHALLDGIAPDLYDAITPQSLGLHEAVADITGLLMAFQSSTLRDTVLRQTGGSIANPTAFNTVAEQFGSSIRGRPLRDFVNKAALESGPGLETVDRTRPHQLCQVVTGAVYPVMQAMHEERKARYIDRGMEPLAAAGRALGIASLQFGRILLRALDYLPPGEVSFGDYLSAIVASDMVSHEAAGGPRDQMIAEFARRGVYVDTDRIAQNLNFAYDSLATVDRETLRDSEWAAYDFVGSNRNLFGIPDDIPFAIRPRLDVTKTYYHEDGEREVRELIVKASWEVQEPNPIGRSMPSRRALTVGTTVALAWNEPVVRARLMHELQQDQADDRTALLRRLLDEGTLIPGRPVSTASIPNRRVVGSQTQGGRMRVSGTGLMLHIAPEVREEADDA